MESKKKKMLGPWKWDLIACPETSVNKYQFTLRNVPEGRRSRVFDVLLITVFRGWVKMKLRCDLISSWWCSLVISCLNLYRFQALEFGYRLIGELCWNWCRFAIGTCKVTRLHATPSYRISPCFKAILQLTVQKRVSCRFINVRL